MDRENQTWEYPPSLEDRKTENEEAVHAFVPGPLVLFFLLPQGSKPSSESPFTPSSNAWETLSNQPTQLTEKEVELLSAEE